LACGWQATLRWHKLRQQPFPLHLPQRQPLLTRQNLLMLQNRQKLQLLWQHLPQPQQPLLRQQHLLLLHQRQFQTKVIPLG
jgi:hypothetical protein